MLRGALERPGLVGPRNEGFEERVDPILGSRDEQIDRRLWRTSDGTVDSCLSGSNGEEHVAPPEGPRDDEDVGPLGEPRDEEQIGREIIRKDTANAARNPQTVGAAVSQNSRQSRKRSRSLEDSFEHGEDGTTKRTTKHPRLCEQPREFCDVDEEYLTVDRTGVATNGDATLVHPPTSADSEAAPMQTEWTTAHGINSKGASIRVPVRGVWDLTSQWMYLHLPRSSGLSYRPWTEEEKEDLRVYIQDYGVEDWALLSQCTNRRQTNLQYTYYEIITARNRQAGRPERAGIPDAYPNLASPPCPQ